MTERKPKTYEEQEHIEALVFQYQEGNEFAGEELLRIYGAEPMSNALGAYIGKFYRLVRFGKIDFKDYDSRVFMSCFFPGEERGAIIQSYQYKKTKEDVVRKVANIVEAMKVVEEDELKQELRFLFLRQVKRYKKTNRSFGAYLNNSYRYEVARYIIRLMKQEEPYVKLRKEMVRLSEELLKDEDSEVDIQDSIFTQEPMMVMDESLGNSWVRGLTCGEQFKNLTPLQRMIIKLNYYDGWSDGRIADKMGIHINTIFRQRKKAGEIVRETVEQLKQEG